MLDDDLKFAAHWTVKGASGLKQFQIRAIGVLREFKTRSDLAPEELPARAHQASDGATRVWAMPQTTVFFQLKRSTCCPSMRCWKVRLDPIRAGRLQRVLQPTNDVVSADSCHQTSHPYRHVITQSSGKQRVIDDAARGDQSDRSNDANKLLTVAARPAVALVANCVTDVEWT